MDPPPAGSLARGAALITVATAVSRVTGFVRVLVVAAALGTTFLANTYQTANTAPNIIFELVAAGVLTSVFVPTFVEHLAKGRRDEGWHTGNVLMSVALVALIAIALLLALLAPLVMRILTLGVQDQDLRRDEIALGTTFLRLFAPQVVFYGAGMIMTAALHAHRRFTLAAVAPIFNNVVVIAVYLLYAALRGDRPPTVEGITTAETIVLGLGTTFGVVAMTLCLVPTLRSLGWRFRFQPSFRHPAVGRALRLGVWALGYAGGYQAGLVVVLLLANRIEGGVAAYQWAYTFFYLPHALFGAPIFHVLFPEMTERALDDDPQGLARRLGQGARMLLFLLAPIAALLFAAAVPLTRVTLEYGVMTGAGAELVARVLIGFAFGLPAYSLFLVLTRAYYALGDTRTPALVNAATVAIAASVGATLFFTLPEEWAVGGLALGHSIAYTAGAGGLSVMLARRLGGIRTGIAGTAIRSGGAGLVSFGFMRLLVTSLVGESRTSALLAVVVAAVAGFLVYAALMRLARSEELIAMIGMVRRRPP